LEKNGTIGLMLVVVVWHEGERIVLEDGVEE